MAREITAPVTRHGYLERAWHKWPLSQQSPVFRATNATPGGGPLFSGGAVRAGTHLNCVGADTKGKRELPEGLLRRSQLFADDREQSRSLGEGQWDTDCPSIEIGDVLTGKVQLTRDVEDITVFDMTGLALQDLVVAEMLLHLAETRGLGKNLSWPW